METQKKAICRLCLKISDSFEAMGDMKDVLDIVLLNIKLTVVQESVMCRNCVEMLLKCFDFKAECIYTQDYIVPFVDNQDTVKVDLKDVYLIKNENCIGVPEDQDICAFCMRRVKSCYAISLKVENGDVMLEEMIGQCLPELEFGVIKKPVICVPCRGSLENCFHFVMNCLRLEEKIQKYRETLGKSSRDQINLSQLLQFTMRDVITGEADENSVAIIKVEKQIYEERENANNMNNAIFNNEERFIPKNMMACKEESKNLGVIKTENELYEENKFKDEDLEKVEDPKFLLTEEIEIKTDESDFYRTEGDVILSQLKVTTRLVTKQNCLMPYFKAELSKPYAKQTLANENVSRYKCDSCSYQTINKCTLQRHLLIHKDPSEVKMHKCERCSYQTRHRRNLIKHLLSHTELSDVKVYKCECCSYQTRYKYYLKHHLLNHKSPSEVTMYKCDSCSFQTKRKANLKPHFLVHSRTELYKCDSCSYQTKNKYHFRNHIHSQGAMYTCDLCSFQTRNKSGLKKHSLNHKDPSEVTMYKCDFCSFQAKRRYGLERHSLVHKDPSEITMYKCNSCLYQAKRKFSLSSHLLIHKDPSEITMYKCYSCLYETRFKNSLRQHCLLHSQVKMYKCNLCSFQAKNKSVLKKHSMKHKNPSKPSEHKVVTRTSQKRQGGTYPSNISKPNREIAG